MIDGPSTLSAHQSWWLDPLERCRAELEAPAEGLTQAEAERRFARYGPNQTHARARLSLVAPILTRLKNPLVLILLGASVASALAGELTSFVIVVTMVLISVTLDVVQEVRSGRAADRLRDLVAIRTTVLRDGARTELPATALVRGDIVLLSIGDLVPADGRVIEASDLFIKQALLTGEPYPVEKHTGDLPADAGEMDRATNALFAGTTVISGSARMLVVRTGGETVVGRIGDSLRIERPPSAFELGTRRFGILIMRVTILMVLFVLLTNVALHRPMMESFMFAIALAVGLTPELLPMIVTVTLSHGALRMAQKRVIVKRLAAIQDLGSMDVLCTDKTGTLTEAKIRLERHVDPAGRESARVLELAYLNSFFETGLKSPLDEAILRHSEVDVSAWTKLDEVPFDFERRRVSVLVRRAEERLLVIKGAPEDILRLSSWYEISGPDDLRAIDAAALGRIQAQYDALGREGFRVLAVAWHRAPPERDHARVDDETELVFSGFAAFLDPAKASAGAALAALARSGVAVKIVTGDSELVTQHLCGELKVPVIGVLTGAQLAEMDDAALRARVETTNLFCRVNPAQKDRVILALKARGHVVGYLGDGINDAPALHSADVGISVEGAVDVAKDAADMILHDHDLGVLHDGAIEGRRTAENIMKYIMMGTSSNFGNMFSMAVAAAVLPFLPMLPTQILLNNMLYDLSEIAIPLDRVDDAGIAEPRAWDIDFVRRFMLVIGPVSSAFDALTFVVMLQVFKADAALFQTGWFIESLATQVLVIFIIRTRGNPLKSRAHPLLVATSLGVVAIGAILPFTPIGAYFGFVAPPPAFFAILAAMVVAYLAIVTLVKQRFYAHYG